MMMRSGQATHTTSVHRSGRQTCMPPRHSQLQEDASVASMGMHNTKVAMIGGGTAMMNGSRITAGSKRNALGNLTNSSLGSLKSYVNVEKAAISEHSMNDEAQGGARVKRHKTNESTVAPAPSGKASNVRNPMQTRTRSAPIASARIPVAAASKQVSMLSRAAKTATVHLHSQHSVIQSQKVHSETLKNVTVPSIQKPILPASKPATTHVASSVHATVEPQSNAKKSGLKMQSPAVGQHAKPNDRHNLTGGVSTKKTALPVSSVPKPLSVRHEMRPMSMKASHAVSISPAQAVPSSQRVQSSRKISIEAAPAQISKCSDLGDHSMDLDDAISANRSKPDSAVPRASTASSVTLRQSLEAMVPSKCKASMDHTMEFWIDPILVVEYADEIFEYLHQKEKTTMPKAHYMNGQPELNWNMRAELASWIVQIHFHLRLKPETLYLTINIIDRTLSVKSVSAPKLRLVGITALFLAAKFEEIYQVPVSTLADLAGGCYSTAEILTAESYILGIFVFDLSYPGPLGFMRRISAVADGLAKDTRALAKYFIEATIMGEEFLSTPPSLIAAASMYLSMKMIRNGDWTEKYVLSSGYAEEPVFECARAIFTLVSDPKKLHSVFEKYSTAKFDAAAVFVSSFVSGMK